MLESSKAFSFRGALPPDPLSNQPGALPLVPARGTPVIGSHPLAMTPAFRFLFLYDWSRESSSEI